MAHPKPATVKASPRPSEARRRQLQQALAGAEDRVVVDRSNSDLERRLELRRAAARAFARARQRNADQADERRLQAEVDHYRRILDRRRPTSPSNARAYARALQTVRLRRRL